MKLGIDASNLLHGGGGTHLEELLRAADPPRFGFSEVVVWGQGKMLDRLSKRDWLRVVRDPALQGNLIHRTWWRLTRLDRLAREARCDILFVPGSSYTGSFRPFVTMARNLLPFDDAASGLYGVSWMRLKLAFLRRVQSRTFRSASGIVFLTSTAQAVVTAIAGPLSGRTAAIPHGISDRFFREPQRQLPIAEYSDSRPFRLLYVSALEPYKHQSSVVSAVTRLRADGYPVALDLVGGGRAKERKQLKHEIRTAGLPPSIITYHGSVAYTDLPTLYHCAAAFVFASSCENLPNILLEAMAASLPIASSSRSVMPEVLGDGGVYFDPESPESIALAVRELLDDPQRREAFAKTARDRVRAWTWDRCASSTFAFLGSVGAT